MKEYNEDAPIKISLKCIEDIMELLKEQEAVVRCKDCIFFQQDDKPEPGCGFCGLVSRTYDGYHYCSDGIRKEAST